MPITPGAYDATHNGGEDYYVAKLTPDGANLVYGTYVGDDAQNWYSTHNFNIDSEGNAYVAFLATSAFPVTEGPYYGNSQGGGFEVGIVKLSQTGTLINSTLIGGSDNENADGIYIDNRGNVFVTGETQSDDIPVTDDAFQSTFGGSTDAFMLLLSADFTELLYCTYMGGSAYDAGRSGYMNPAGTDLYITGSTDGDGWPVLNAYQSEFSGGQIGWGAGDVVLAKFNRDLLAGVDDKSDKMRFQNRWELAITPNPITSNSVVKFTLDIHSKVEISLYNLSDELVSTIIDQQLSAGDHRIAVNHNGQPSGIYFLKASINAIEETQKYVILK
jgi:hemin uptake protein HemP